MKDAGIFQGDLVIVHKGAKHKSWDIIIAQIDWEFTLKYYIKEKGKEPYLQAANSDYEDIYPKDELVVFWVVTAVVRKYSNS